MDAKLLLKSLGNDGYQDIRFEALTTTTVKVKNDEVKEVSVTNKKGGHARALCGGGFGSFSFNKLEDAPQAIAESIAFSRLIPGNKTLAPVPVVVDKVLLKPSIDPRTISIEEKKNLLLKYCTLAKGVEEIAVAEGEYYEQYSQKVFVNNEGTHIEQEQLICGMTFSITSKRDGLTQQTRLAFGGSDSFEDMYNKEEEVLKKAQITVDLLSAKPIKGGKYDVILDHEVGGLFIHEAFGHLSEADNLLRSNALKETMELGKEFATPILNVIDDPGMTGYPGSYIYDDEGVRGKKTYLIKDGILTGRLHSRETASHVGEEVTGHARAKNYEFNPLVRMGNIYIDKGPHSFEEMIAATKDGLYLFGSAGGQTTGEMFTFAVQGGYVIKDGEIKEMVRDIVLTGNLFSTLKNIDMICDNIDMRKRGGCGKDGQILISSGNGSPFMRIKSMAIGGK
ncbi:TldD/PmbA family protein [Alkaliphilus serpentinus]|uniref:TldD/PmbA family protein n=1 Tax=Alkaliphilus serpentinus TaxID=1482731 RepID=A0A833M8F7_9FIRM|nr:TldD/PmbA family protein [Alkaliphilus serpentinus]KAB3532828.1 TldD/PmbA family protein [Alkaliphilus serpentinus]